MNLRDRVRSAVEGVETPAYLETRIRARLRESRRPFRWMPVWASATAVAAVFIGVALAYQFGHLRLTVKSQEAYIGNVSNQVAEIMRVGLGDHIHCSVFRKFAKNPPSLEQFAKSMGPEFSGLIPIVRKETPEDLQLVTAHRCRYHGRPFVHLALKSNSHLLSVVIAEKGAGEALAAGQLYGAGVQRFQIAAFESSDRLVYVVSDLGERQNLQIATAMAPAIRSFLVNRNACKSCS